MFQYNWGYPAALKNALDYLYHEWLGKPAVVITYGTRGGGKAAAQLQQVSMNTLAAANMLCSALHQHQLLS